MTGSDEWGKDPAVQMMRKVFRQMELAQGELLKAAGISIWDSRLRRWREVSRLLLNGHGPMRQDGELI